MKSSILFFFAVLVAAFFSSGCTTTRGAIEAASTKVEIHDGKYKSMVITLPKEMDTTGLHLDIDPKTGHIKLDSDKLKSSSQAIIESAGAAQAASIQSMSKVIGDIVPVLAKIAADAASPESAVATAVAEKP